MTGEQLQIAAMFVGCAVAIPIVVIGMIRDPWSRGIERQRKADESEARRACAPQRPHVTAAPIDCPLTVDEVLAGYADGSIDIHPRLSGMTPDLVIVDEVHHWSEGDLERVIDVINGGNA